MQICPECGWQPHADEIILWGYGHGQRATVHNAQGGSIWGPLIIANAGALGMLLNPQFWRPQWWWSILTFVIVFNTWMLILRRRRIAELQLPEIARFTPEGCGQRTGTGAIKLRDWRKIKSISVGYGGSGLVIKCQPHFVSLGPPIEINVCEVVLDQATLREQLETWHREAME